MAVRLLTNHKALANLAINLLSIPPSSAGIERTFSLQARIHSKNRTRLSDENVARMMTVCCMNLNKFKKVEDQCNMSDYAQLLEEDTSGEIPTDTEEEDELIYSIQPLHDENDVDESEFNIDSLPIPEEEVPSSGEVGGQTDSDSEDELGRIANERF